MEEEGKNGNLTGLKLPNTEFKVAAPFSSYAIQDGNLITGQQQNSGAAAARMVVAELNK